MTLDLSSARRFAKERWSTPNPHFSHGQDLRSSDQGLLSGLFGGLVRAVEHGHQNAGRVLVDRTDIRILWESYQFPLPVRELDYCCRELDLFVRDSIFPIWETVSRQSAFSIEDEDVKLEGWCRYIAEDIFGHEEYLAQTSVLLFFLCPGLPIFPGGDESYLGYLNEEDRLGPPESEAGQLPVLRQWWERRVIWAIEQVR